MEWAAAGRSELDAEFTVYFAGGFFAFCAALVCSVRKVFCKTGITIIKRILWSSSDSKSLSSVSESGKTSATA